MGRKTHGSPRVVLVVEDEPAHALDLPETLHGFGCAVLGPADSATAALRLLRGARCPDFALLDGRLPYGAAGTLAEVLTALGYPSRSWLPAATSERLSDIELAARDCLIVSLRVV